MPEPLLMPLPCPVRRVALGRSVTFVTFKPRFPQVRRGCTCPRMALGSRLVVPALHRGPPARPAQEWYLLLFFKEMGKQTNRKA